MGPQPCPPRFRGFVHIGVAVLVVAALAPPVTNAQTGPRILHDGLRCVLSGEHLILEALVEPADGLTTVKAYFRANIYSQFYYVEMVPTGEAYQAVLPKPSPEITGLHYYLEAMDSSFNSVRTAEYTPEVVAEETSCRERNPTPAAYLDGTGAITVGSTGGGPAFPSGFLTEGIAGTIPTVGRAVSGGGSGLLIGGAAAAGAAVGVGVLVAGGSDDPALTSTSSIIGAVPTSTTSVPAATTAPPAAAVTACFDTSPAPPRIPVGGSVRFDASCTQPARELIQSYSWNFNDGRGGRDGRVVNRVYNNPGRFGAVLTVTTLDGAQDIFEVDVVVEESAPPPGGGGGGGGAAVTISKSAPGSGTSGTPFAYTITVTNNSGSTATVVDISDVVPSGLTVGAVTFSASVDTCSNPPASQNVNCDIAALAAGASGTITINVTPTAAGNYTNTANLLVGSPSVSGSSTAGTSVSLKASPGSPRRTRITSHLELPPGDGAIQARLTFNEARSAVTDNSGPSSHDVPGGSGENTVEGAVVRNPSSEGVWRFDFRGAPGFVPGSILVDSGQVVSQNAYTVVLRIAPGVRRVRFRYRLE